MSFFHAWLLLVLPVASSPSGSDNHPLQRWLYSLTFHLPATKDIVAGSEVTVDSIVCDKLKLGSLKTKPILASEKVGLHFELLGIDIECRGEYASSSLMVGSGQFTAGITGAGNKASAMLTSSLNHGIPISITSDECSVDLNPEVSLSGYSVGAYFISLFSPIVKAYIHGQIMEKACAALQQLAEGDLTDRLSALNELMLPPGEAPQLHVSRRRLAADEAGLVDWRRVPALDWARWLVGDVLGPEGLRNMSSWALKGSSTLDLDLAGVPGTELHMTLDEESTAGLKLDIVAQIDGIVVEGAQNLRSLCPIRAVGAENLEFCAGLGTEEEPAGGFGVRLTVKVKGSDEDEATHLLEHQVALRVSLLRPSVSMRARVSCDAERWLEEKTLGQWLFDPVNCARSLLAEAPSIQSLDLKFDGVASPLSYTSLTKGWLEQDISLAFNSVVLLFNHVYESLLPGAISRYASSTEGLQKLNEVLGEIATPAECMSHAEVLHEARKYPLTFEDWPSLFSGHARSLVDNVVDAFLQSDEASVAEAVLAKMPAVSLGNVADFKLHRFLLTGLSHLKAPRIFITDEANPKSLGALVQDTCTSHEQPHSPTASVSASWKVGGLPSGGEVKLGLPCGTLGAAIDLSLDIVDVFSMPVPPSTYCALVPFLKRVEVTRIQHSWDESGYLFTTTEGGERHEPISEVCSQHAELCHFLYRFASSLNDPKKATEAIAFLQQTAAAQCDPAQQPSLGSPTNRDVQGMSYVDASSVSLWTVTALVVLGLAAALTALVAAAAGSTARDTISSPLAVTAWASGSLGGKLMVFIVMLLLLSAVCLRVVACFALPYVTADVSVVDTATREALFSVQLGLFTYLGTGKQFLEGGSPFCLVCWIATSVITGIASSLALLYLWTRPVGLSRQHALIRGLLLLARLPFQEVETLGSTALALGADVNLPYGLQQQLRTNLQAGAYVAMASTACALAAGLCMLAALPARPAVAGPGGHVAAQLAAAAAICVGVPLWLSFTYLDVRTTGIAGTVVAPAAFKASRLGEHSLGLQSAASLLFFAAPLAQAGATALRLAGLPVSGAKLQRLQDAAGAFSCCDVFLLAYVCAFFAGIDGFTSSFVNRQFPSLCQGAAFLTGEGCIGVEASVGYVGLLGLAAAALASVFLYVSCSVDFHRTRLAIQASAAEEEVAEPDALEMTCSQVSFKSAGAAEAGLPSP